MDKGARHLVPVGKDLLHLRPHLSHLQEAQLAERQHGRQLDARACHIGPCGQGARRACKVDAA
eukprot:scaffold147707_cov31-Tisochrysis_lutea.AAC.2